MHLPSQDPTLAGASPMPWRRAPAHRPHGGGRVRGGNAWRPQEDPGNALRAGPPCPGTLMEVACSDGTVAGQLWNSRGTFSLGACSGSPKWFHCGNRCVPFRDPFPANFGAQFWTCFGINFGLILVSVLGPILVPFPRLLGSWPECISL